MCVWKICATINGYFFWVPNQHRMKNPKQTFLMQKTLKTPCIKKCTNKHKDAKSKIMKTMLEHIICQLHCWFGKTISWTKHRNAFEFMGALGCSWLLMGVHECSFVSVWPFIVCMFLRRRPFSELNKSELKWTSLSDCSTLGGIGNKFQAEEPQGILIINLHAGQQQFYR